MCVCVCVCVCECLCVCVCVCVCVCGPVYLMHSFQYFHAFSQKNTDQRAEFINSSERGEAAGEDGKEGGRKYGSTEGGTGRERTCLREKEAGEKEAADRNLPLGTTTEITRFHSG